MRIEYKYSAILYGYLDSCYFALLKKNLFKQSAARATLLYPFCFSRLMRKECKTQQKKKLLDKKITY